VFGYSTGARWLLHSWETETKAAMLLSVMADCENGRGGSPNRLGD